jgi:hypothetical protein
VIFSFMAGAYVADRNSDAIVSGAGHQTPLREAGMHLTALPDGHAARDSQTVAYADRRNGPLRNTRRSPDVQTVADHVSNDACASRGSVAQLRAAYARQGSSTTSVPLNRPAIDAGQPAEPAADPDHLQADYFLRLLIPSRRRIDRKIDQHQKAIAIAETRGAPEHADRIRRMLRVDEQERQTLNALIDRLQRRFPVPPLG